ncbi:MAG: Na/Pi cotransporter family protein [Rhizobiaceae bacterium]
MSFLILILGGIGLFLIGVSMMTEGLKSAAGGLLQRILASATSSPLRGLAAGIFITALVRSSSAVTVATIGFVNAGLLTLAPAVWVVFGTNIGTTTTAWLVVLAGTGFEAATMALPMVGIGMIMRLAASRRQRLAGLGQAIAGFGVFFLGIGFLQVGFDDVTPHLAALDLDAEAWLAVPAFVLLGFALTVVTQSSSAAIAIALTASAGGSVPLMLAAAAVIGTNIGTTSTAAFAAIGATAPARRVAAAHIIFNVLTAVIALLLLPWLVAASEIVAGWAWGDTSITLTLAVFHTIFNCLGVLAIAGVARLLIDWLGTRFVTQEERIGRPRYLDTTLVGVPDLALRALVREARRMADISFEVARTRIGEPETARQRVAGMHVGALRLGKEIRTVIGRLGGQTLPDPVSAALPDIIRGVQHLEEVLRISNQLAPGSVQKMADEPLLNTLAEMTLAALRPWDESDAAFEEEAAPQARIEEAYQELKSSLLLQAGRGRMDVATMERAFLESRLLRRVAEEALKARRRLKPWQAHLEDVLEGTEAESSAEQKIAS